MNTKSSQNHFAAFFLSITDQQSPETTQWIKIVYHIPL
jgi:hypothetical protein